MTDTKPVIWAPNPSGPSKHIRRTGRMGLQQYARILAAITSKPQTAAQVGASLSRQAPTMREILWRLEHMGEAHVTEWVKPAKQRGMLAAVFAAGPGSSVPYPRELGRCSPGSELAKCNPRPELIAFCSVLRALRAGATRNELHEQTGIAPMRLGLLLRVMRAEKLIHRSAWAARDDGAGLPAEVFTLGKGRDEPRPEPMTAKQKQDRYTLGRRAKRATLRVAHAISGSGRIVITGVQSYGLLGGAA